MEVKYSVCNHCGNIIEMVKDQGVPVMCCGEPMQELKAGVTDAAVEKHVPVYTVDKQHVHVVVGTKAPEICPVCNHPQSYFEIREENY